MMLLLLLLFAVLGTACATSLDSSVPIEEACRMAIMLVMALIAYFPEEFGDPMDHLKRPSVYPIKTREEDHQVYL
jgi:hypothetical protein